MPPTRRPLQLKSERIPLPTCSLQQCERRILTLATPKATPRIYEALQWVEREVERWIRSESGVKYARCDEGPKPGCTFAGCPELSQRGELELSSEVLLPERDRVETRLRHAL